MKKTKRMFVVVFSEKVGGLWEEIEEPSINDEEFMNLFSRQVVEKKIPKKKVEKPPKTQVFINIILQSYLFPI